MNNKKLLPALQLKDNILLKKALNHLTKMGIQADIIPVSDLPTESIPKWAQPKIDGWFLRIHKEQFEKGMSALQVVMGYTPD